MQQLQNIYMKWMRNAHENQLNVTPSTATILSPMTNIQVEVRCTFDVSCHSADKYNCSWQCQWTSWIRDDAFGTPCLTYLNTSHSPTTPTACYVKKDRYVPLIFPLIFQALKYNSIWHITSYCIMEILRTIKTSGSYITAYLTTILPGNQKKCIK